MSVFEKKISEGVSAGELAISSRKYEAGVSGAELRQVWELGENIVEAAKPQEVCIAIRLRVVKEVSVGDSTPSEALRRVSFLGTWVSSSEKVLYFVNL